ncbi:MAG TPA: DUF6320 domain-containing protein [Bacteroidales bacterium]|jgi:hypothetical protein|nr:DUF6320 domain-containing protein [Bacteroidales bacterium]
MNTCISCGVELEDGIEVCPLCGKSPGDKNSPVNVQGDNPSDIIAFNKKENRKHLWELGGIIAFSSIAVCTIVDLLISRKPDWSLYSDVSVLALWLTLTLILFARTRMFLFFSGLMVIVLSTLLAFDLIDTGPDWFFPVGLPLAISSSFAAWLIVLLCKKARFKGFNIIAAALIILAGLTILTELVLDNYYHGMTDLRWSLIAAVSALPVALILSFYHYRLKKGKQLDSFFHV